VTVGNRVWSAKGPEAWKTGAIVAFQDTIPHIILLPIPPARCCIIRGGSRQVSPRATGPSWQRARVWRARFATGAGEQHTPTPARGPAWSVLTPVTPVRDLRVGQLTVLRLVYLVARWMSSRVKPPPEFPLFDRLCPCGEATTTKKAALTVSSCDLQASARYRVNMPFLPMLCVGSSACCCVHYLAPCLHTRSTAL
jgi:hypothetical protein